MEEHVVKPIFSKEQTSSKVISDTNQEIPEQQVESNIPTDQNSPQQNENKKSIWDSEIPISDPYYKTDPLFFKVADYLGMNERLADLNKNKIVDIINWGRNDSPTKDDADVLLRIKDVEKKVGQSPGFSERRYAILHRYISLSKQKTGIEKEMSVWERGMTA